MSPVVPAIWPPSKRADQLGFKPKRFWQEAGFQHTPEGYAVTLDGRMAKTPAGKALSLPNFALAALVAKEWEAVGSHVDFEAMHLTRLAYAAIDRMGDALEETLTEVSRYAETDLLCYPADYPQALVEREAQRWGPILAWAKDDMGLLFEPNLSLIHKPQPRQTIEVLGTLVSGLNAFERAGVMAATPLFGSLILALALFKGRLTGDQAYELSRIGEDFQSQTWGQDAEAKSRADDHRAQAVSLEAWFKALKV